MQLHVALEVKNPSANAGDIRDVGSIPGSDRYPGGGHSNLLWYSCQENPTDRGALAGYSPYGHTELDTTEAAWSTHTHIYGIKADPMIKWFLNSAMTEVMTQNPTLYPSTAVTLVQASCSSPWTPPVASPHAFPLLSQLFQSVFKSAGRDN